MTLGILSAELFEITSIKLSATTSAKEDVKAEAK